MVARTLSPPEKTAADAAAGVSVQPASFARAALGVLLFTLAVILFGAVVRITGSGAGCGQHWPTCQGEIIHLPRRIATAIELSHRVTSGLSALAVFWLTWRGFREFGRGHRVRRAVLTASAMMVVEALLGAVLVRLALVGNDASLGRALVMPLHLLTTSMLTASLGLSLWWSLPHAERPDHVSAGRGWVLLAAATVLVVSASGALTALGDTVYPVQAASLAARVNHDQGPAAHFLERLRVVHPLLAVLGATLIFASVITVADRKASPMVRRLSGYAVLFVTLQVTAGGVNVMLSAPGWMQVVHLLLANLVWLSLVLLSAELGDTATTLDPAAVADV